MKLRKRGYVGTTSPEITERETMHGALARQAAAEERNEIRLEASRPLEVRMYYAYSGMPSDATITLKELSFYRFNKGDIILPFPEESLIAPHKLPVRFLYSLFYMLNELLRKPYLNSIGTNSER